MSKKDHKLSLKINYMPFIQTSWHLKKLNENLWEENRNNFSYLPIFQFIVNPYVYVSCLQKYKLM